jgi:tetratricopeptide (TPR) repeat protein
MSLPGDQPQRCKFCGKPAIGEYNARGNSVIVCAACDADLHEVEDTGQRKLAHCYKLAYEEEKFDEALGCLNAMLEANRHRDHDLWLARSVAASRAMLLRDTGRYEESLRASNEEAQLGFEDGPARWVHSSGVADALSALGRDQEALAAVEDALGYEDPRKIPSALGSLVRLAELSEKLGQPVDPKWRIIAEAVAKYHSVDMPTHDSLGEAIHALNKAVASKQERPHPG